MVQSAFAADLARRWLQVIDELPDTSAVGRLPQRKTSVMMRTGRRRSPLGRKGCPTAFVKGSDTVTGIAMAEKPVL
jgi:hypothetical protein